jgi:YesN/AraC family two-component response regulator
MAMEEIKKILPNILWVDLRIVKDEPSIAHKLSGHYRIHCIATANQVGDTINKTAPRCICFEYDYPELAGLKVLQQTKLEFSYLPVLMLTEYHSENLAIWSFRTRVWDYLVKPIPVSELLIRVEALCTLSGSIRGPASRRSLMPHNPTPNEPSFRCPTLKKRTSLAVSYIETHYQEKIHVNKVAALCHMEMFTFSRHFKKEHGITFRDYLIRHRIAKAKELLQNPHTSITSVTLTVGFNDFSHFARTFQQIVGMNPSQYRANQKILSD